MSRSVILVALLLVGCASQAPRTVVDPVAVEVPGKLQFKPIPPELLAKCGDSPAVLRQPATNGDLLQHDHAMALYAGCLQAVLDQVKSLQ
jgi:hypothetical protein